MKQCKKYTYTYDMGVEPVRSFYGSVPKLCKHFRSLSYVRAYKAMKCVKCNVCRNHRSRQRRLCTICREARALPTCRPEHCWVRCLGACRDCFEEELLPPYDLPSAVSLLIIEFLDDRWRIILVRVRTAKNFGTMQKHSRPHRPWDEACKNFNESFASCRRNENMSLKAHARHTWVNCTDWPVVRTYVRTWSFTYLFVHKYVHVYEYVCRCVCADTATCHHHHLLRSWLMAKIIHHAQMPLYVSTPWIWNK